MDNLEKYRQIVRKVLIPYSKIKYAYGDYQNEAIFDEKNDRYLIVSQGWEEDGIRHHSCLLHLEIINDKIWIQKDNTEEGIATDLLAAGIPKNDIVLGFHEPKIRKYTEFAVT